jgi:hypothetical protein
MQTGREDGLAREREQNPDQLQVQQLPLEQRRRSQPLQLRPQSSRLGDCRHFMCNQKIRNRSDFLKWALANHPDKCSVADKEACTERFKLASECHTADPPRYCNVPSSLQSRRPPSVAAIRQSLGLLPPKTPTSDVKTHIVTKDETSITVAVPTPDRPTCMKEYVKLKQLGKGQYGEVLEVCKDGELSDNKCSHKYALKITNGEDENDLETSKRDPYFLRMLANEKLDGQYIVPRVYDAWLCHDEGNTRAVYDSDEEEDEEEPYNNLFVVMDRWDGDMEHYAKDSFSKKDKWVYGRSELLRMFRLAARLGQLGIMHGDLKPDQYLERDLGGEISVTDFGFSGGPKTKYQGGPNWAYVGTEGWSRCPKAFTPGDWDAQSDFFPVYHNIIQLESYIMRWNPLTYVRSKDKEYRFGGIKDLDRSDPKYKRCDKYPAEYKLLREAIGKTEKDIMEFTLDEIIPGFGEYSGRSQSVVRFPSNQWNPAAGPNPI